MAKTYSATVAGRRVTLEFDRSAVVVNRARLVVEDEPVDQASVFYGDKDLRATLSDGTDITVRFHSGMMGELSRPQVLGADDTWTDLIED